MKNIERYAYIGIVAICIIISSYFRQENVALNNIITTNNSKIEMLNNNITSCQMILQGYKNGK